MLRTRVLFSIVMFVPLQVAATLPAQTSGVCRAREMCIRDRRCAARHIFFVDELVGAIANLGANVALGINDFDEGKGLAGQNASFLLDGLFGGRG